MNELGSQHTIFIVFLLFVIFSAKQYQFLFNLLLLLI